MQIRRSCLCIADTSLAGLDGAQKRFVALMYADAYKDPDYP